MAAGAHRWGRVVLLAVAAAALVAIGMYFEESLLYFPTRELAASPKDAPYGLEAEDLRPETEDGVTLFGWWIRGEGYRPRYCRVNGRQVDYAEAARAAADLLSPDAGATASAAT